MVSLIVEKGEGQDVVQVPAILRSDAAARLFLVVRAWLLAVLMSTMAELLTGIAESASNVVCYGMVFHQCCQGRDVSYGDTAVEHGRVGV